METTAMGRQLSEFGEVATARAFGMTAATVHQHALAGILSPLALAGERYYSESDRLRLAVIQKATRLGFSDHEIWYLLIDRETIQPEPIVIPQKLRRVTALTQNAQDQLVISRTLIACAKKGIANTAVDVNRICEEIQRQRQRL